MAERPILFSAPMVRAILNGSKTQTRRVVKPQPSILSGELLCWKDDALTDDQMADRCPYGKPGDKLWVRETWQAVNGNDRARHIMTHPTPRRGWIEYAATPRIDEPAYKWRPSIHMPRWASRITLDVTGVRVERLQDISEADAMAEGIVFETRDPGLGKGGRLGWCWKENEYAGSAVHGYELLWDHINGPGSWEANPFCWVVEFKVETPNA